MAHSPGRTLQSSQSNIRNLQKQLFDQSEMISHKGFYWQNYKTRNSRSPLTATMAKHFSTNEASQVQAPTWNPFRCDRFHSSSFTLNTKKYSAKVISTLLWDSFKFDKAHQGTLMPWLTRFKKQNFPFMQSTWRVATGLVSVRRSSCAQRSPLFWQEQFRQNFRVLSNAFTILRRIVQRVALTSSAAEITRCPV